MSFEVVFKYKEKDENGQFADEIKEKLVKVGKPEEDTPLEQVAGKIIAQLARRNIFIVDIEVYEYTKRKINYQETKDGIKIRGRKFSFDAVENNTMKLWHDDGIVISTVEVDPQEQLINVLQSDPTLLQKLLKVVEEKDKPQSKPPIKNLGAPLRFEAFDPVDSAMLKVAMSKGLKFTHKKKYPIFEEKPASVNPLDGMLYITVDDAGNRIPMSDKYFIIPPILTERFLEDSQQYVGGTGPEPQLSFESAVKETMPDLRVKR